MTEEQKAQPALMWREYIIRVPKPLGDTLDKAMSAQQQFEDREIENSEYFCWLLLLGLEKVSQMNLAAKQADARIIEPGNGLRMPL